MYTAGEIIQTIKHYATHPITKTAAGLILTGAVALSAFGIPAYTDARDAAHQKIAELETQVDGQLEISAGNGNDVVTALGAALTALSTAEDAGVAGESLNSLKQLTADGVQARYTLIDREQATRTAHADLDTGSWRPQLLMDEHELLANSLQELRVQSLTASRAAYDLEMATDVVVTATNEKKAADAQQKKEAAEAEAAEAAEAEAAREAEAREAEAATNHQPSANYSTPSGATSYAPAPASDCRAQAEGLIASLSGGHVLWSDTGHYGMTGAGFVTLGSGNGQVTLSSGTDPNFWCTAQGSYIAAHESAHVNHDRKLKALIAAGYKYSWQLERAEAAADCITQAQGYGAHSYGCTPEGQTLANLILG